MRLMILSGVDTEPAFRKKMPSRALLNGLQARGIDYRLVCPRTRFDSVEGFDGVLSWWYRGKVRREVRHRFEETLAVLCQDAGIPLIQPLKTRSGGQHHLYCLERWHRAGVPCARYQTFKEVREIALAYPLVLRVDASHRRWNVHRVESPAEAVAVVAARRARGQRELDLALEFIDTRYPDGTYRKRRAIVVGDRVIPRQETLSADWIVKLDSARLDAASVAADRRFMENGEERPDLVLAAVKALDTERIAVAVDYSRTADGRYAFWEVNGTFGMAGALPSGQSERFRAATGRSIEDCRRRDLEVGKAFADEIADRIRAWQDGRRNPANRARPARNGRPPAAADD